MKEQAMQGVKHAVLGMVAAAAITCAPIATAEAHGFGHHPWGLGRGLLGAVVGLATLPIAIAPAALSATEPEAPYQSSPGYDGQRRYAPPAYYAAPQTRFPAGGQSVRIDRWRTRALISPSCGE